MSKLSITWRVDDGYANNGTHNLRIDEDELLECDSVDEAMQMVEDSIQDAFDNKVSWTYESNSARAQIEDLFANKPEEENQ